MVRKVDNSSSNSFQDEKYLLKFHTGSGVVSGGGRDDAKKIHSPVIKLVPLLFLSNSFARIHIIPQVHNDVGETGGHKQARLLPHEHNPGEGKREV